MRTRRPVQSSTSEGLHASPFGIFVRGTNCFTWPDTDLIRPTRYLQYKITFSPTIYMIFLKSELREVDAVDGHVVDVARSARVLVLPPAPRGLHNLLS